MKTVAIVPIKLNNERLPGKNTKPLSDGTPLIHVLLQTLLKLKRQGDLSEIIVFCSNEEIKKYLFEGITFLKRPEFLDSQELPV